MKAIKATAWAMFKELLRRICLLLWWRLTRRQLSRFARWRVRLVNKTNEKVGQLTDEVESLRQQLRQQSADAAWTKERLDGQIAILTEQLGLYTDIVQRERQRVAAETAIQSRRESEATMGGMRAAGAGLLSSDFTEG